MSEERIDSIETSVRRLRWCVGMLIVACAWLAVPRVKEAAGIDDGVIEGRTLVLRDSEGRIRVEIETSLMGPHLRFFDGDGERRLGLETETGSGRTALELSGRPGSAYLGFRTEDMGPELQMQLPGGGEAMLTITPQEPYLGFLADSGQMDLGASHLGIRSKKTKDAFRFPE